MVQVDVDVTEADKTKVENFDIQGSINEIGQIIDESAEMFYQIKKIRFDYLAQVMELYSRIDFPSIMIESCRQKVMANLPKARDILRNDE